LKIKEEEKNQADARNTILLWQDVKNKHLSVWTEAARKRFKVKYWPKEMKFKWNNSISTGVKF
jgi:hypothetical protein